MHKVAYRRGKFKLSSAFDLNFVRKLQKQLKKLWNQHSVFNLYSYYFVFGYYNIKNVKCTDFTFQFEAVLGSF